MRILELVEATIIVVIVLVVIAFGGSKAFAEKATTCTDDQVSKVFGSSILEDTDILGAMQSSAVAEAKSSEGDKARKLIDCVVQKNLAKAKKDAYDRARLKEVPLACAIIEVTVKKCNWYNPLCNDDIKLRSWIDNNHYTSRNELQSENDKTKSTTAYLCSSVNGGKALVSFVDVLELNPFGYSTWFRLMISPEGEVLMRDGGELPERVDVKVRKYTKDDITNPTIKKVKKSK